MTVDETFVIGIDGEAMVWRFVSMFLKIFMYRRIEGISPHKNHPQNRGGHDIFQNQNIGR